MSDEKTGIFVTIRFWTDFVNENDQKEYYEKTGWSTGSIRLIGFGIAGVLAIILYYLFAKDPVN